MRVAAPDPNRAYRLPASRRSGTGAFREFRCQEAAVRDLTHPATSGHTIAPKNAATTVGSNSHRRQSSEGGGGFAQRGWNRERNAHTSATADPIYRNGREMRISHVEMNICSSAASACRSPNGDNAYACSRPCLGCNRDTRLSRSRSTWATAAHRTSS